MATPLSQPHHTATSIMTPLMIEDELKNSEIQRYYEMVQNVGKSWDVVKAIPNYQDVAGELLFRKIFEIAPSAFTMFSFSLGYELYNDRVYESEKFKQHARSVVSMLDTAVHLLGPDMDLVTIALLDLGAAHVAYGVLPIHYPIVGEALLRTLGEALGDHWTTDVKNGWEGIYDFISRTMIEGAKRVLKVEKDSTCANSSTNKEQQQIDGTTTEAYYRMVTEVNVTWDKVKKIPDYETVAGTILFKKIFEIAPGAEKMFQFSEGHKPGSEEMYKGESFLRHARTVVRMLDAAVDMLGPDLEIVTGILLDLGAKHVPFGVEPVHYPIVGEALLWTLEKALGEYWTEDVAKGWTHIYGFVSSTMIRGANDYIRKKEKGGKGKGTNATI